MESGPELSVPLFLVSLKEILMRLVRIPVSSGSPRTGVQNIIGKAKSALRNFCSKTIIEKKLAPKSFSFVFDFHDSRRQLGKSMTMRMAKPNNLNYQNNRSIQFLTRHGQTSMHRLAENTLPSP
jgi:hypothetical protein